RCQEKTKGVAERALDPGGRSLQALLLLGRKKEALPGLIWDLGQQLGDLSLESGGLDQESGRSSGFYEDPNSTGGPDSPPSTFCGDSGFSGSGSYGRLGPSEPRGIYASERPKSLGDASPCTPELVGARAAVPRSYSAPYPTAAGSGAGRPGRGPVRFSQPRHSHPSGEQQQVGGSGSVSGADTRFQGRRRSARE
ncbi:dapper homolog 3, partial [Fukomys damarensis]|uniref:dapper homolog 3 n=1 Tax=Fukomys damarensis TaxID=885580 RepID=UPI00145582FB